MKIVMVGIVLVLVGALVAVIGFPLVGYQDASAVQGTTALGLSKVKLKGTVADVYDAPQMNLSVTVDISLADILADASGQKALVLEGAPNLVILTDRTDLQPGDKVAVKGYSYVYGQNTLVTGDDLFNLFSSFTGPSSPAQVSKVPAPMFWVGIVVLAIAGVVAIVGYRAEAPPVPAPAQPQQPYPQQYYQQQYQQAPQQQYQRPAQQQAYQQAAPSQQPYQQVPRPQPQYQQPAQPAYACQTCGGQLQWMAQYGRWYCGRCQRYL